ncbi:hypothetical protein D3C75_686940 [compost metagenome]
MNQVVKFDQTKRRLNWEQEEALHSSKKRDSQRRDARKIGREVKTIGENDE